MMENKELIQFYSQLEEAVERFPNLKILTNGGKYLKGILDIETDEGINAGSFLIEIHYSKGFPYRFPKLLEVGGAIPNNPNWHKYSDNSCCITVSADEILKCKNGLTVNKFIMQHAIPFFANYLFRKKTGRYKNGEYAHGVKGHEQFYSLLLQSSIKANWAICYLYAFINPPKESRNDPCFCGSGKKFKKCHDPDLYTLRQIGKAQVNHDFKLMDV